MMASPLLPSFHDTYSLSISWTCCKPLCIVIKFLVLWSFCLNSFFVHFIAQSAGAVEYTDSISAEGLDSSNECTWYDTKQSDGDVSVMHEVWGLWSTTLLPSLPGSLSPGLEAPDRVLSIGQIELFDFKLCTYAKLNCLNQNCLII